MKNQKSSRNQIKRLSVNKTRSIEIQAKKYLSSVFSQNQLDLIMKKRKKYIDLKMKSLKHLLSDISASVHIFMSKMN